MIIDFLYFIDLFSNVLCLLFPRGTFEANCRLVLEKRLVFATKLF